MKQLFKRKIALALFIPAAFTMSATSVLAGSSDVTASAQIQDSKRVSNYRGFRASDLIGKSVKSPEGRDLGEIKDLVVRMSTGAVRYAILSFGGFMGVGDNLFAIPVKTLKLAANRDDLVLDMDKARLQQQKSFPRDKWPALKDKHFWGEVDRLAGTPAVQPADAYYAYRASELIGKDVENVKGEDVGDLKDLVIDMNAQTVHYAVLEVDPGVFKSEKLYSVPLSAFMFRRDNDDRRNLETGKLMLNLGKSGIAALRGFDKNRWPNLNDPTYLVDVDRYFVAVFPPRDKSPTNGSIAMFTRMDANNDGFLSRAETQSHTHVNGVWNALDRNNDGKVSNAEFSEHYRATLHIGAAR